MSDERYPAPVFTLTCEHDSCSRRPTWVAHDWDYYHGECKQFFCDEHKPTETSKWYDWAPLAIPES
jgi:hypothetical protein